MKDRLKGGEWRKLGTLLPYLWEYKWRVVLALAFLVAAKLANVGVPLVLKRGRRRRSTPATAHRRRAGRAARRLRPAALSTTLFTELREFLFVRVTQRAMRAHRARGVPPPARAVAALPPRAPDRRHDARHRARHARHLDAAQLHAVLDPADAGRDRAGGRGAARASSTGASPPITFGALVALHRASPSRSPNGARSIRRRA